MAPESLIKFVLATLMAIVPAVIWGYIFYRKQVGKKTMLMVTFAAGALFVTPLLFYKYLWQYFPWLDAFQYTGRFKDDMIGFSNLAIIPLDVVLTFMLVGVIEEVTKLWAVKMTDRGRICSIDDAIEMTITAALGFSFAENILYFYNIIVVRGIDNILYPFIFRSLFSTFAHIMFSGIMGYYYGMALFAPDLMKERKNKRKWPIVRFLSNFFSLQKERILRDQKIMEGLIIAVVLHAIFNIFLEMNWVFLLVPFLTLGYVYLNYLLEKKEAHKVYGYEGRIIEPESQKT
jgi:RsiW-degrading membrane proteinase PrsW (M82 family)